MKSNQNGSLLWCKNCFDHMHVHVVSVEKSAFPHAVTSSSHMARQIELHWLGATLKLSAASMSRRPFNQAEDFLTRAGPYWFIKTEPKIEWFTIVRGNGLIIPLNYATDLVSKFCCRPWKIIIIFSIYHFTFKGTINFVQFKNFFFPINKIIIQNFT